MLNKEIYLAKQEWEAAKNYFDLVSDPELVDYAVFALETAKKKYIYLLKKAQRSA